jgi:hypothetical protein
VATRGSAESLRFLKLFGNKIALSRDCLGAQSGASHFTDAFRDAWLSIHKDVQVVGIEGEKACSRDGSNGRGSSRSAQRRNLAEEMTGTEPNALVLELDLHFSGRDEIH